MRKQLFLLLAIAILLPLGIIITHQVMKKSGPGLWNSTPPTVSMQERHGERRKFLQFKTFESKDLKFSIKMPTTWTTQEENGSIYFLSPKEGSGDTVRENINLVRDDAGSQTLEQYSANALSQVKTLENYTLLGQEDITLAGHPGKTIVYTAKVKNVIVKFQQAWTVANGSAYILTLATSPEDFPEHSSLFVRMANSLKLQGGVTVHLSK